MEPRTNEEYSGVYVAAAHLLGLRPIREIIRASYSGTFIDEYQDCTVAQHGLALALGDASGATPLVSDLWLPLPTPRSRAAT